MDDLPISQPSRIKSRQIRVFISSTFRDMQTERDELVLKVFPQLRQICAKRGVGFTEVDLRWGVTEEQAKGGWILPICLAEIENCRPYFIGLLGERYGWLPEAIPDELIRDQPWLKEHLEHSITELEILYGVLRNPAMADHAFFYLRDRAYPKRIPEESRADFEAESEASREKQSALKEKIRRSNLPVREVYPDPETLGQMVLEDLKGVIDKEFPEEELTPLDRARLDHETFAEHRARVYIGRPEYLESLDAQVSGTGKPMVVLGESGSGKSTLLANWALKYREENPEAFVLFHFIGSSPQSAGYTAILRRIMGEIKERYNLSDEIPDTPEKLKEAFPNWLSMATAPGRGRFVLILDALNQLEDRDKALDLYWLPEIVPKKVRLIVSTLPGRSQEALEKHGWPTMKIEPLTEDERRRLIKDYLALFAKQLSGLQVEQIASAPQAANPLFLRALLDELKVFGIFEQIPDRIEHYLEAESPRELYGLILKRLEEDYESERPGLVGDALSLLWAAWRGLSETELLEMLDTPRLVWAPLYLAIKDSLVSRSGLLGFYHDFLRQAVHDEYLDSPEKEKDAHLRVADYFADRGIDIRKIDELPWQLAEAGEWGRLKECLEDLPFFKAVYEKDEFEVLAYWQRVENNSAYTCSEAYEEVIGGPSVFMEYLFPLSEMFYSRGHLDEALSLHNVQVGHYRATRDTANLQASIGGQALIHKARGDLDSAMELHKEEEWICIKLGDMEGLQASLGNQALIHLTWGNLDDAMKLLTKQERICEELGDKTGLQCSLGNKALIHKTWGDLDRAMELLKEQERICRELGDKAGLGASFGNQGLIHYARGELECAMGLHEVQERICRDLGYKAGLSRSFCNQALIYKDWEDLDRAMELHKMEELICHELGDQAGLSRSLGNQASIHYMRGELDRAMKLHEKEARICRKLGDKAGLGASLGNQGLIHQALDDLVQAMSFFKEQARIYQKLKHKAGLSRSFGNQATVHYKQGNLRRAKRLLEKQKRICQDLGDKVGWGASLGHLALVYKAQGKLARALELLEEKERIFREQGD